MKRIIITTIAILVSIANFAATNVLMESSVKENGSNQASENDGWIQIGEITLSNYYDKTETIKANLQVREIGQNLIYRVEYQGEYYATRWHDYSNTYHVTINGTTYRCDVPANSSVRDNNGDNGDKAKFVGKWRLGQMGWYVDISYINGRYSFNLNPNIISDVVDFQETSNGIIFTYVEKFDKRPELIKKGWRNYVDDRDNRADPGYPTTGQYKYDREVVYYTVSIHLSDDAPIYELTKIHTFYYLGSTLTYADTDTDLDAPGFKSVLKR